MDIPAYLRLRANTFRALSQSSPASLQVNCVGTCIFVGIALWPENQSEADVTGRGVHRLRHACRRAVALAVIQRAQKGPSLNYFTGDLYRWHLRVIAVLALATFWVEACTTTLARDVMGGVPVIRPLPYVTDHVEQAVAIRRKLPNRGRSLISIGEKV